jgi:hypothetical protein
MTGYFSSSWDVLCTPEAVEEVIGDGQCEDVTNNASRGEHRKILTASASGSNIKPRFASLTKSGCLMLLPDARWAIFSHCCANVYPIEIAKN